MKNALTYECISGLMSCTRSWVVKRSIKENWPRELKTGAKNKQTVVFPLESLPSDIQTAHFRAEVERQRLINKQLSLLNQHMRTDEQCDAAWQNYNKMPQSYKDRALKRAEVIRRVRKLWVGQKSKTAAIAQAQHEFRESFVFSEVAFYAWEKKIKNVPDHHWVAFLLDQPKGPQQRSDKLSAEAWGFVKSYYLSPSKPTAMAAYKAARSAGFALPSVRCVQMRLVEDVDIRTLVFWREGEEALAAMFPPIVRSVDDLRTYQLINIDGHLLDVMMTWEDGTVSRPLLLGIQCVQSRRALVWRLCKTENKHDVLAILGACFRKWGLPEHIYMDNGRAFASKWISGGGKAPFRGVQLASDPLGILPKLGIEQTYVLPHHGQSKPIERMWRTFCAEAVSKAPECEGAYVGNRPENAPYNRGEKTIKEADLRRVIQREFVAYNEEKGRRGGVAHGRSYGEVFAQGYATQPIRKCTPAQLQLCLLPVEKIKATGPSGKLWLFGNWYWHEALNAYRGQDLCVRFNPDALHEPIYVYDHTQTLICEAPCTLETGFNNVEAARANAKAKADFTKAAKALARAERTLTATEIAAKLPQPEAVENPESRVVQLVRPVSESKPKEPMTDNSGNVISLDAILSRMQAERDAERALVAI